MTEKRIVKWATLLITFAALIVAYYQLDKIDIQLAAQQESTKWQNYNLVNKRYADLIAGIPMSISNSSGKNFNDLSGKDKIWVKQYVNLTSEEYWMHTKGLLPDKMWKDRIAEGVALNLESYDILIPGFRHFIKKPKFYHSSDNIISDFEKEIEKIIVIVKKRPPRLRGNNNDNNEQQRTTTTGSDQAK